MNVKTAATRRTRSTAVQKEPMQKDIFSGPASGSSPRGRVIVAGLRNADDLVEHLGALAAAEADAARGLCVHGSPFRRERLGLGLEDDGLRHLRERRH